MRSLDYSFIHLKFSQHSWFFHTNEFYQYTNFWVQLGSKVGTLDISFHSHWVHLVKKELTLLIFLQITGNQCDTIPENVLLISNNIIEGVNTQLKLPTLFHSLLLDTLELPILKKKNTYRTLSPICMEYRLINDIPVTFHRQLFLRKWNECPWYLYGFDCPAIRPSPFCRFLLQTWDYCSLKTEEKFCITWIYEWERCIYTIKSM